MLLRLRCNYRCLYPCFHRNTEEIAFWHAVCSYVHINTFIISPISADSFLWPYCASLCMVIGDETMVFHNRKETKTAGFLPAVRSKDTDKPYRTENSDETRYSVRRSETEDILRERW